MSKKPNYVFDDELYHHGIQGQKWGERRFQNEDGSWTAEGRERYGKGDGMSDRAKARMEYKTEKYKMYLKSKEQRNRDKIAAKEERQRIKEQSKNDRLMIKEQAKISKKEKDAIQSKEELRDKIEKLNLQIEYNKKLREAEKPTALTKANEFFNTPTGKLVGQVITSTIPNLVTQSAQKVIENKLKYANPLDKKKQKAMIETQQALTEYNVQRARGEYFKALPDNYEWYWDPKTNSFRHRSKTP